MESSTVSTSVLLVVTLLILGYVIYELVQLRNSSSGGSAGPCGGSGTSGTVVNRMSYTIIGPYTQGNGAKPLTVSNSKFTRSSDQPGGIEYSYAFWMRVRDWDPPGRTGCKCPTDAFGQCPPQCQPMDVGEGVVFIKGVPGGAGPQCPSVTIRSDDPTRKNVLNFYVDQFSREKPTKKITIDNLPSAQKHAPFFHVAITVCEELKIYINGELRKTSKFTQVVEQNESSFHVAPGGPNDAFDGEIGSLTYYNYALSSGDVVNLANTPPVKGQKPDKDVLPPYFAPRWYWSD